MTDETDEDLSSPKRPSPSRPECTRIDYGHLAYPKPSERGTGTEYLLQFLAGGLSWFFALGVWWLLATSASVPAFVVVAFLPIVLVTLIFAGVMMSKRFDWHVFTPGLLIAAAVSCLIGLRYCKL
jgi:hypothetical protein